MHRLAVQFLDQGFHRMLFEAMPIPVFVVDEDVRILECNTSAARLLGRNKRFLIGKRCGEALNCIHALEAPGGCGHSPDCGKCVVRKSVRAALRGRSVVRHEAQMEFGRNGKTHQGETAGDLPAFHLRTAHVHLADPRRFERLSPRTNLIKQTCSLSVPARRSRRVGPQAQRLSADIRYLTANAA